MENTGTALPNMKSGKPWYAHRWPWLLMIGPVAVILAGLYTGWLAFANQDALVVDDYYKQGKAINQDLRRDQTASNLHMSLNLRYDPATGRLNGRLTGDAQSVSHPLRLRLIHSTRPERDISLAAQPDASGAFSIALPMLDQARWQVQVENTQREWRLYGTWKWPQEQTIEIKA
jgi:uncharacterized protein